MKKLLLLSAALFATTAATAHADAMPGLIDKGVTADSTFCEAWVDYSDNQVEVDCDGKKLGFVENTNAASLEFNLTVSLIVKKGLKVVSCAYSNPDHGAGGTELCYLARQ